MNRKVHDMLKNYVSSLTDENLEYFYIRLRDRYSGDLADVLTILQKSPEIDRWFASSTNARDFYGMVDRFTEFVFAESARRNPSVAA